MSGALRHRWVGLSLALAATAYAGAGLAADPTAAAPQPAAGAACPAPQAVFEAGQRAEGMVPPRIAVWPIVPPYPATLPKGQTGIVSADYIVKTDGTACNIQIKALQGPQDFADAATQWLTTMPFAPATKNGQPIPAEMKRLFRLGAVPPMHQMQGMHFQPPPHKLLPQGADTTDAPDASDDK
jgi:hypothetical protein